MVRTLTACLVLGLAASLAPAQSSAPPTPSAAPPAQSPTTLQVESQIVLLDVSVTNAAGKPVTDLRQDEFRITEQNLPQTIASFKPPFGPHHAHR